MTRPVGRPSASSTTDQYSCSEAASQPLTAAKDSASPSSFLRISRSRLDLIASQLTDDDQAVLAFVADVRLASGAQLARRLWSAGSPADARARSARRALGRLEHWRVVDRLSQRIGGIRGGSSSIIYGVGPSGRRLLERRGSTARRLGTPGERHIVHTLAITELVVRLHEASLRGEIDVLELQTEPECWRQFLGGFGARRVLKPDLYLRIGVGAYEDRWFVEVDLATESATTIAAKAERYIEHFRGGYEQRRNGVYPRVLWTVPSPRRAEQVTEALSRLPEGTRRLFTVWAYAEVVGRLSAEAST